jgi:tetratricopeptide (TPR) repeat protein
MRMTFAIFGCSSALAVLLVGCGSASTRVARHVDRGERYFEQQDYTKAALEFRNALQIDPKLMRAHLDLGRASDKLGNLRGALAEYQLVVDAEPNNVAARVFAARVYLLAGQPRNALDLVAPALSRDASNPQLLTVRGAARAQLGDFAAALADATQAHAAAPDDEYTVALLASLLKREGELPRAVEVVEAGLRAHSESVDLHSVLADLLTARGDFAGAENELSRIVAIQPAVMANRYALAHYYLSRKDTAAAERTLVAAVAAEPHDDAPKFELIRFQVAQRGEGAAEATLSEFIRREPENYDLRLELAASFERAHEPAKAEAICLDVIKRVGNKPAGFVARDVLAALRLQAGKTDEALALIDETLKDNPRDGRALSLRANIELARGNPTAAISDLRAQLHDDPGALSGVRALAAAYASRGDLGMSEDTLRAAVQANPRDVATRLQLAQILHRSGKAAEAEGIVAEIVKDAPANVTALDDLFKLQAEQKQYEQARTTGLAIARAMPSQGLGLYLAGTVDAAQGKTDAATEEFAKALDIQPDSVEPLNALIDLEVSHDHVDKALQRLDWVISKAPKSYVAYNLKGQILTSRKQYADAKAAFVAAISISPEWWTPYQNLSRAQVKSGDVSTALKTLSEGLSRTHFDGRLAAELAGLYELLNQPARAIEVYESAFAQNPKSVPVANNLAMLLVNYRTDAASMERAKNLVAPLNDSKDPVYQDTVGWVRYKSGDYRSALTILQRAADTSPTSALVRYHLGMAQLRNGDSEDARKNIQRAVESGRHFLGFAEAKAALADLKNVG